MSTSLLNHAFGLTDQEYLKTEYKQGTVIFHIQTKEDKLHINKIYRTLSHFCPELGQDLAGLPDTRERKQYHAQELCMAGIA
ncbi:MAG: hypothetical protein R6V32_11675 [Bacteroidales bacterium]